MTGDFARLFSASPIRPPSQQRPAETALSLSPILLFHVLPVPFLFFHFLLLFCSSFFFLFFSSSFVVPLLCTLLACLPLQFHSTPATPPRRRYSCRKGRNSSGRCCCAPFHLYDTLFSDLFFSCPSFGIFDFLDPSTSRRLRGFSLLDFFFRVDHCMTATT